MDFWLLAQRVGDKGIEKKKDRKGRWRGPGQSRMKCQVDFGACVCPCCAAPVYCSAVTVLVIPSTFFTDSLLPQYCYPHAICYISPANDILLLSYPPQTRYSTSYFPSAAETCHVLRIAYRIIIQPSANLSLIACPSPRLHLQKCDCCHTQCRSRPHI